MSLYHTTALAAAGRQLTRSPPAYDNPPMIWRLSLVILLTLTAGVGTDGCGLIYGAGTRIRTRHMSQSLKSGETALQVHREWGEPDLRKNLSTNTEVWSYVTRPNTNDIAATIFYTSTKAGDNSRFLDLKFVDSKLVSWSEAEHTVPAKQGSGFSYGLGPGGGVSPISHY
jgi:hypothetical protein